MDVLPDTQDVLPATHCRLVRPRRPGQLYYYFFFKPALLRYWTHKQIVSPEPHSGVLGVCYRSSLYKVLSVLALIFIDLSASQQLRAKAYLCLGTVPCFGCLLSCLSLLFILFDIHLHIDTSSMPAATDPSDSLCMPLHPIDNMFKNMPAAFVFQNISWRPCRLSQSGSSCQSPPCWGF